MATSSVEVRIRTLVENAFKAWREGTGGPYDLLADNVSWIVTGRSKAAKTYPSKESFMSEVIRPFNARMRARLIPTTLHELVVDGERVVVRFDAAGTAIDGKPYSNTYAWFLTVRDDKIVNAVAFFDSIAFDDLWTRVTPA
ncbi:MAG TPA: nuclear transport factor 2 family protein [Steroidobacteraceae bacterium]